MAKIFENVDKQSALKGVGLTVVAEAVGYAVYRFAVRPIASIIKTKKAAKQEKQPAADAQ